MNSWAASIAPSMASLLRVSMAAVVRLTPSLASASSAADSFFSCALSALTSLTRSLCWEVPLVRMIFPPFQGSFQRSKRRCPPKVSSALAVPDVLRHRQLGEILGQQRPVMADALFLQQHH